MVEQSKDKKGTQGVPDLLPKKHLSAIEKLAASLDLTPTMLIDTLKKTAFSACVTDAQFVAAVVVANTYKLNPLLREMTAFPGKSGGVIPIVEIDGWISLVNRQKNFNGVELIENFNSEEKVNKSGTTLDSVTATFYITGKDHPVIITEYMDECFDSSKEPWKRWPRRMLRHKAYIQGARIAFGFSGIYDEDEKNRIIEAEGATILEPVIGLKHDKDKKPEPQEQQSGQDTVPIKEAEIVDDPLAYALVGDLARFGENATKAKFLADNIVKCGGKFDKEKFLGIVGGLGFSSLVEITKFEDLVKLTNVLLEEVKKLEQ